MYATFYNEVMVTKNDLGLKKAKPSFSLLYEVSRVVVSGRYLEEILLLVVELTARLTGSKICSMMILDEKTGELVIKATQSLSDHYRTKPPIKVGESVSGRAVLYKKPITVLDVSKESDYKYPEIARAEGLKSLISVPMMIKDQVIGVLNCYTAEEHEFAEEEKQILVGVANQAALAIENTKLLAEKIVAVENLEIRKKVDRAKGILMDRCKIGESKAYRRIQKLSMDKGRSLKDVAEAIIVSEDLVSSK